MLYHVSNASKELNDYHDYKTKLQEVNRRAQRESLLYVLVGSGPDHDKR